MFSFSFLYVCVSVCVGIWQLLFFWNDLIIVLFHMKSSILEHQIIFFSMLSFIFSSIMYNSSLSLSRCVSVCKFNVCCHCNSHTSYILPWVFLSLFFLVVYSLFLFYSNKKEKQGVWDRKTFFFRERTREKDNQKGTYISSENTWHQQRKGRWAKSESSSCSEIK